MLKGVVLVALVLSVMGVQLQSGVPALLAQLKEVINLT